MSADVLAGCGVAHVTTLNNCLMKNLHEPVLIVVTNETISQMFR
jgi:hypothetical protein